MQAGLLPAEELSVKIEPTVGSLVNQEEELGKLQIKQESTEPYCTSAGEQANIEIIHLVIYQLYFVQIWILILKYL